MNFTTVNEETMTAYYQYMRSLSVPEKIEWTKRIANTSIPVLAIPLPELRKIAKQVLAGDFETFLEKVEFRCYEDTVVYVATLGGISDFDVVKKHLPKVLDVCDNWSTTDSFRPKITKTDAQNWWDFSGELLASDKPFTRRLAIIIMFSFVKTDSLSGIFDRINTLSCENEYYVNMAAAWLVAECFIKHREETLSFFANTTANNFIVNKAICKCRDSFRATPDDKQLLLSFRR